MGPPKTSRKGKKAWRKNIDDAEVVAHVEQETHQQRRGPAVESLQDHELFFVDKSVDETASAAATAAPRRAKAKREMRPTRAQLILSAPQAIKPVVELKPKRKDGGIRKTPGQLAQEEAAAKAKAGAVVAAPAAAARAKRPAAPDMDLWSTEGRPRGPPRPPGIEEAGADPSFLPSTSAPTLPLHMSAHVRRRTKTPRLNATIRAVEVDDAGCSYNPDREAHQEAVAVAVAREVKRELKKALAPTPVPLQVDAQGALDELARLQTEAEADENEIELGTEEGEGGEGGLGGSSDGEEGMTAAEARRRAAAKKTKKDRNKEARRKEKEREEVERKALKRQRAALSSLKQLTAEVEQEAAEKELKRQRRQVVKEEKALQQPPRLGKQKFEDLPVQVLTSEEVGEGLRRLKAYPMLAMERFKSLQKRGLIEPRRPAPPKGPKKLVVYEKNARREKAEAGQAELEELQKKNRKAAKAARG